MLRTTILTLRNPFVLKTLGAALAVLVVVVAGGCAAGRGAGTVPGAPESVDLKLYEAVNRYRRASGLDPLPLSRSLVKVARLHVRDLAAVSRPRRCNLHSWSDKGRWGACCYTDHSRAQCMWDKPRELTDMDADGFEIAYWHSERATPERAMRSWRRSPRHDEALTGRGPWAELPWKAMGAAVYDRYAVVWFSLDDDPVGYWR